jgi:hypothetical protein
MRTPSAHRGGNHAIFVLVLYSFKNQGVSAGVMGADLQICKDFLHLWGISGRDAGVTLQFSIG